MADMSHIKEIEKAKPNYGKALKVKDLKGKVILLEYWGLKWPPCLGGLPHLQVLQDKFKNSDKFIVITSHAATYNKKAIDGILKKSKATFTNYQQLMLKKALPEDGLPHVVLFDKNGKVVEKGEKIQALEQKIEKLIYK